MTENNIPPKVEDLDQNSLLREMQLSAGCISGAIANARAWGNRWMTASKEWRSRVLFEGRDDPVKVGEMRAQLHAMRANDDTSPEAMGMLEANLRRAESIAENFELYAVNHRACDVLRHVLEQLPDVVASTPRNFPRPDLTILSTGDKEWWRLGRGKVCGPFLTRGGAEVENPHDPGVENMRDFATLVAQSNTTRIETVAALVALFEPREQVMILSQWLAARPPLMIVADPAFWITEQGCVDAHPDVLALDRVLRIRDQLRTTFERSGVHPKYAQEIAGELSRSAIVSELILSRLALAQRLFAEFSEKEPEETSTGASAVSPLQKSDAKEARSEPEATIPERIT